LNYAVVANSRTIAAADDPGVAAVAGDIADPATADSLVATAVERFGRVDSLINNAGVFVAKPFTEYTAADYEHVTAVNLTGFFHLTQRVIAQMLSQGDGGHVVNVTTTLVEHADARPRCHPDTFSHPGGRHCRAHCFRADRRTRALDRQHERRVMLEADCTLIALTTSDRVVAQVHHQARQ
jgi:NAD(P)-dependent dehydrogenase (short-subunit alcohol dehydrogenase family)